jgi:hypothetical protein
MHSSLPIFGFAGRAGSGKDAAGRIGMSYLAEHRHKSTCLALAEPIKTICTDIFYTAFGTSAFAFHGTQKDKNESIEAIPGWTGRRILQHVGTEGFRHIHPDVWVLYALGKARRLIQEEGYKAIFITDVRFENEAQLIQEAGGVVIRITRPSVDEGATEGIPNHASENEISLISPDHVINNAGTLNDLNQKVRNILCQRLPFLHLT